MNMDSLQKLYLEELRDLYSAEKQILEALPKMEKGASSTELQAAFREHREQTKEHVTRLEEIFSELSEKPMGKMCHGMAGVIEEGAELLKKKGEPEVLDAGLISAAQHVEHYEIAGYGNARAHAELLGESAAAEKLGLTLGEEKETDEKLTNIAQHSINLEAVVTAAAA